MHLTADAAGGSVQVTVMDSRGEAVAVSQPVQGDVTEQEVLSASPGRMAGLKGRSVRLKFALNKAKLYSFVFKQ